GVSGRPDVLRGHHWPCRHSRSNRRLSSRARAPVETGASPCATCAGAVDLPRLRRQTEGRRNAGEPIVMAIPHAAPKRIRSVRIASADTAVRHGPGGLVYLQSRHRLDAYPMTLTERLEYWADRAGDRAFLAQ